MTLVEVIVSMLLLTAVLGGALSAVTLSARGQNSTSDALTARMLAADLLEVICDFPYDDPADNTEFDVGGDEVDADKTTFDDLDDFHGWTETPPSRMNGTAIPGASAWTRTVTVEWVDPLSPSTTSGSESGAKLVTITVERAGATYASMSRVRTRALDATGD